MHDAASETARAIQSGIKRRCARVDADVTMTNCVARYQAAKERGGYSPCLECSLVIREIKTKGDVVKISDPADAVPVQEDPFKGWELLTADKLTRHDDVYVSFQTGAVVFSNGASIKYYLRKYASVDVAKKVTKSGTIIGFRFREDEGGYLKVCQTKSEKSAAVNISNKGICRAFEIPVSFRGRFAVEDLGEGCFSVNITNPLKRGKGK
jgi:hypothetical protein